MQELIWFSIPGSVFVLALVSVCPNLINTDGGKVLLVLVVPVLGYFVHQSFRVIYEITGGFARNSRQVLGRIELFANAMHEVEINLEQAFLIWETTLYSDEFPSSFREHDQSSWHYYLSFWSISFSAALSILGLLLHFFVAQTIFPFCTIVLEVVIGSVFLLKALSTYRSINREEIAVLYKHSDLFMDTAKVLKNLNL